jgi:PAS domain S-box-containing protein
LRTAVLVGVAYYVGSKIGFALTLKPSPVSTLWPPNAILLAALLLTPTRSWWILLLSVLPAHLVVQLGTGIPVPMVLSWYVSNSTEALIGAGCIRGLIKGRLRFDNLGHITIFLVFGAFLASFLSSFLDAAMVTLNRWGQSSYAEVWRVRFLSNLLAALTLVPVIVAWVTEGLGSIRRWPRWRYFEAGILTAGLLMVCTVVFTQQNAGPNTTPALLYAPLPFLLWAAIRFGPRGTSVCLLIVSALAIWGAGRGQGPFLAGSPTHNVLSIQLFLIVIAVPLMILAAALQERERAEDRARKDEERLTLALSAAQMGTWDWDIPADKASWAGNSRQIFGLSETDPNISLEYFLSLVKPEDRASVSQAIGRAVEQGDWYESEFRIVRPDGAVRWILGKGKVLRDAAGRPLRMLGVKMDVTDRKRAEEILRESEERFRLIADSTPAYLWMSSPDSENSFINTPLATFLGIEEHELGPHWVDFIHPDDVAAAVQEFQEAMSVQRDFRAEFRLRRHDGEYRWVIDLGVPRWSPQGEFLGYAGSLADITPGKLAEDTLRERETQLRLITDTLPAFVAYVDAEQRYRFNNRICEQWHARSRTEMFGIPVREVIGEELYAALQPYIDRALAGESVTYEAELPIPGLGLRSHVVTHAPDIDADGTVRGFVAHGYDNSERKQADAAVIEWKNRYEAAVEFSDQLLFDWDPRTNEVTYGGDVKRILGYSEAEMAGGLKRWIELIHPEDRVAFSMEIQRAFASAGSANLTFRVCRKDAGVIWVEYRGHFFRDGTGRILRMVGFVQDITERKRAEAALQSSEERFAKAFRSSPDAIAIARLPGSRIIDINDRWEAMFGYSRDEAIGRTAVDLGLFVHQDDRHRLRDLMDAQGYVRDFELDLRTKAGEVLRGVVASETVDMEENLCVISIIRDITKQKRGELEAAEHRRELAHLGRVVMLGELSGALAHELNQPLTAVLANARAVQRLLTQEPLNIVELQDILEDIAQDGRRAGDVIHHLRALLQKGEMQLRPLDLNELVTQVLELLHSDLIERRCAVETRLAHSLPLVNADRVQLQQVLLNLIVNACDAMNAEELHARRVTIVTAPTEAGSVQLSIADQGTGIPADQIDRVFEPFVTWKEHGLGLGLTICRSIVTAHGGRLWAVNNPDRGATFHLVLSGGTADSVAEPVASGAEVTLDQSPIPHAVRAQ